MAAVVSGKDCRTARGAFAGKRVWPNFISAVLRVHKLQPKCFEKQAQWASFHQLRGLRIFCAGAKIPVINCRE
ncbi:MAG: hypothetical protein RBR41_00200 [Desulfovibrio sp.]|uniref:hypothetical protein n=1 Tax=Desulfovibrio sp. TaxID=885 RepID=UPI002A3656CA|nr:hypothetical protein [Desulfovibrio sp.]MDY0258077.1 hypothetical protein [Desulfovibrio sp.]